MTKDSDRYEAVARDVLVQIHSLLPELGLTDYKLVCKSNSPSGKHPRLTGKRSGTIYNIDILAINDDDKIIIECKCYSNTNCINQETLAGIAYRIIDTGAKGAILVSTIKIQSGAKRIAQAENIKVVHIGREDTNLEFVLQHMNKVIAGDSITFTDHVSDYVVTQDGTVTL